MKKNLMYVLVTIFTFVIVGISTVKADTLNANNFYADFDESITLYLEHTDKYNELISYYEENYSSLYPYYWVTATYFSENEYAFSLLSSNTDSLMWYCDGLRVNATVSNFNEVLMNYDSRLDTITVGSGYSHVSNLFSPVSSGTSVLFTNYSYSNNPLPNSATCNNLIYDFDIIHLPRFVSSTHNITIDFFTVAEGDLFPSYLALYDGSYSEVMDTVTIIDSANQNLIDNYNSIYIDGENIDSGLSIEKLWTDPLSLLKDVFTAISTIFAVIVSFISFLPPIMQGFLYISFVIAIVLGIIKVIL